MSFEILSIEYSTYHVARKLIDIYFARINNIQGVSKFKRYYVLFIIF